MQSNGWSARTADGATTKPAIAKEVRKYIVSSNKRGCLGKVCADKQDAPTGTLALLSGDVQRKLSWKPLLSYGIGSPPRKDVAPLGRGSAAGDAGTDSGALPHGLAGA